MRAIIIGGGIGGPVAAMALHRAGIEAVVHEAHEGPAEFLGLFLGLGVNGMRVLRDLDALDAVLRADTIPTPLMAFSNTMGKRLGIVSNGRLDHRTPSMTLMRGALQRALADEARARGIKFRYGKRFIDYARRTAVWRPASTMEARPMATSSSVRTGSARGYGPSCCQTRLIRATRGS